ncbi:MAG: hypothetical protein AMK73_01695 [Planctomycetes bacterium SM23_32]|nr:MAG: hypothetical protein AMK73_01695 [Planctomycetes bacterium SM23_32]
MRALFDLTHPADVHFFKHLIWLLQKRGHKVLVASRDKDVEIELLEAIGIAHVCLSRKGAGLMGMGLELLTRNAMMLNLARRFRPDILVGATGVSVGPIGALLHVPRIFREENEHGWLVRAMGVPFATYVMTGTGYRKELGPRHVRYRGTWVQTYLAPQYFHPCPDHVHAAGIDPTRPYIVLRLVSWGATHDFGLRGAETKDILEVVSRLSRFGRVIISCEGPLPESLQSHRNPVPVQHIHDLLASASLCLGEGGTMAAEAAVLGVPSVYCNPLFVGYMDALERDYGLARSARSLPEGLRLAERLLARPNLREEWRQKRQKLLSDSEDIVMFMHNLLRKALSS